MKSVLFFFLIFITNTAITQDQVFQIDHTFQSQAFGKERNITVYLPSTYYKYPEDSFTVVYMLDGHYAPFADMGNKIIDYGVRNQAYLPSIVVGIHQINRGWEFSEPDDEENSDYDGGMAPELRNHLENEVFELIENTYPRTMSFKTLIGHSSGGLFVLNTLFSEKSDLFDAYIAISPAIRPGETYVLERVEQELNEGSEYRKFLYCSSGDIGEREELFGGAISRLDSILNKHPNHGLNWNKSQFAGTDHWSCVAPSFNEGMIKLNRTFKLDEKLFTDFAMNTSISMKEQIEKFYKNLKSNDRFYNLPSVRVIKNTAWEISEKGYQKAARDMYNFGLECYPENFTLSRAKAKHLAKMELNYEALQLFEECKMLLENVKNEMSEVDYNWYREDFNKRMAKLKE